MAQSSFGYSAGSEGARYNVGVLGNQVILAQGDPVDESQVVYSYCISQCFLTLPLGLVLSVKHPKV